MEDLGSPAQAEITFSNRSLGRPELASTTSDEKTTQVKPFHQRVFLPRKGMFTDDFTDKKPRFSTPPPEDRVVSQEIVSQQSPSILPTEAA